jgi:rhodanese-related sulfurtransferase
MKMTIVRTNWLLTCLFAALGLTTAYGQVNFENYDVKEFAELIADSSVVILDVRKADEFSEEHIKGAVLIDQFQSDFVEQAQTKLPKEKTIAVYCRSGRRSANAAGKLADVGYKCVNLKGGILAWKEANMPVNKEE